MGMIEEEMGMGNRFYLGIDQGTTGTASLLLDSDWEVKGKGYMEVTQIYPQPGWVEHDALELFHSLLKTAEQAIRQACIRPEDLASIGIGNQGETVVAWDSETGLPLYNAIVWQDKRTSVYTEQLGETYGDMIREKTGLQVDSYFGATKIRWLLDNVPEVQSAMQRGTLKIASTDTWFIWKLTGKYVTDITTASRTMLLNIHTGGWDQDILDLLKIPRAILPTVCDCDQIDAVTRKDVFLGAAVPVGGSMVDQQAALLGQGCVRKGLAKTTYGTGCFMLMNIGEKARQSENGLLTTIAWQAANQRHYAFDAGIYVAGSAVQWLKNGLGLIRSAKEMGPLSMSVPDNGGVYFVPAFSGLAAPYWDEYARGTIVGLTAAATKAHIARAVQEGIAYQVCDNAAIMEKDAKTAISVMRVDGGMVVDPFLMQFQSDILGVPVEIPEISECTALGAAYMGALGAGILDSLESCRRQWRRAKLYEPGMSSDQRESLLYEWRRAVERSRGWVEGQNHNANMASL